MGLFNKKYLDCEWMKHSIHFFHDNIRMCCSNATGVIFYDDFKGGDIDWNYVYEKRKQAVSSINSFFGNYPKECIGCCEIQARLKDKPILPFPNIIKKVYIQNFMSCNAKCIYCTFGDVERGLRYRVLPHIKTLIEKNLLDDKAAVYMSGGEITISPEFEELLSTLSNYLNNKVEIFTSGIKYCKSIEEAFVNDKLTMLLSVDCSSPEAYKQIKRVDGYNQVVDNLKKYVNASDNAKNSITLKYILCDGINDNEQELIGFINLASELGIKRVRLDVDFEKYKISNNLSVPEHYYKLYDLFKEQAKLHGLIVRDYSQVNDILEHSRLKYNI